MSQARRGPQSLHIFHDRFDRVDEAAQIFREALPGSSCDPIGQLGLGEPAQGALCVMNNHDLPGAKHGLRDSEGAESVGRCPASCIANDVGVAGSQTK